MFCKYKYRTFKKLMEQFNEIYIEIKNKEDLKSLLTILSELNVTCRPTNHFLNNIDINNINCIKIFFDEGFIEYKMMKKTNLKFISISEFEHLLYTLTLITTKKAKFMVRFIYKINHDIEIDSNGVDNYICFCTQNDDTAWRFVDYDYSENENEKCVFSYDELEKYGFTNIDMFEIQEVMIEE